MADVPDHLLKRAAERKAAKEAAEAAAASTTPADATTSDAAATAAGGDDRMAALLAKSAAAKAKKAGGEAAVVDPAATANPNSVVAPTSSSPAAAQPGVPAAGNQRLLTVVKAGSIQDVKSIPTDKVHTWPHLIAAEFTAALACTAFLLVFSTFVNAPLLASANFNLTPNPAKAPWYFMGLQEMLTMFHPMVAGVTIPGVALAVLAVAGYIDRNPSNKPEDRKFAVALFTFFLMFWAVLVIVGSFFRGEGYNFILPWRQGVHHIFDL